MPILAFLFFVVPILEIYVIIKVGGLIGALPTVGIMLASASAGAYLAQSQGRAVWRRFNQTMASGKMPGKEVSDGAMIIFGGALLISPGFLTDILGLTLLLPPTRLIYRKFMTSAVKRTPAGGGGVFIWQHRPDRFRQGQGPQTGESRPAPDPFQAPSPHRSYDVEGSAREIPSDPTEIEPGER